MNIVVAASLSPIIFARMHLCGVPECVRNSSLPPSIWWEFLIRREFTELTGACGIESI